MLTAILMGFRPDPRPAPLISVGHSARDWLEDFHAGDHSALAEVYREHLSTVARVVGQYLADADKENVIHEVFFKLVANAGARKSFKGGNLAAWLTTVARNQAIDYGRRHRRELPVEANALTALSDCTCRDAELEAECRHLVSDFCRHHLPSNWASVFEARWVRELSQREAAQELGIRRTTLAYRELRIRRLLRRS